MKSEKIEVRCTRCEALLAVNDAEARLPEHEMRGYPGERCRGAGPGVPTGRRFTLTGDGRLVLRAPSGSETHHSENAEARPG